MVRFTLLVTGVHPSGENSKTILKVFIYLYLQLEKSAVIFPSLVGSLKYVLTFQDLVERNAFSSSVYDELTAYKKLFFWLA